MVDMSSKIEMSEELLRRVAEAAAQRGVSVHDLVTMYLMRGLDEEITRGVPHRVRSALPAFPDSGVRVPALSNAEINDLLDREDLIRWGYQISEDSGDPASPNTDAR